MHIRMLKRKHVATAATLAAGFLTGRLALNQLSEPEGEPLLPHSPGTSEQESLGKPSCG
jgi:hypothetical protein